jgi:hypothetical protein
LLLDKDAAITLYSFTKYYAIFAEVKGYYGIFVSNNQMMGMIWIFEVNNQLVEMTNVEIGRSFSSRGLQVHICFD